MNTQIQEAANKWLKTLGNDKQIEFVRLHTRHKDYSGLYFNLTPSDIVSIWIQEVVKKWFRDWALDSDKKEYDKWNTFLFHFRDGMDAMKEASDEELAIFYLKEHESKEEIIQNPNCPFCMIGIRYDNPENGEMCAYHKRLYESKEVSNVSDLEDDIYGRYPQPKEEPVSVSVESKRDMWVRFGSDYLAANLFVCTMKKPLEERQDIMFEKLESKGWVLNFNSKESLASVSVEEAANDNRLADSLTAYIKDKHTQEECAGYIDGFKEPKEQDKAIIGELLEVFKEWEKSAEMYENGTLEFESYISSNKVKSLITKATNYINQQ